VIIQQEEDQINTQDNLPSIEDAMEREPCGLRIIRIFINSQSTKLNV
jgi:hypothetical protein